MTAQSTTVVDADSTPHISPSQEAIVIRSNTQPCQSHVGRSMSRPWTSAMNERLVAAASEHEQLVEAIHATDGISREHAELRITAFEIFFKDESQ